MSYVDDEQTPLLGSQQLEPQPLDLSGGSDSRLAAVCSTIWAVITGFFAIVFYPLTKLVGLSGAYLDSLEHPVLVFLYNVLCCSHANWLLPFVPISLVAGYGLGVEKALSFVLSFFAIIPLAAILSFATEQIEEKLGEAVGGLANATFGNIIELIVAYAALSKGNVRLVQTSMIGSILSNSLLVFGGSICWAAYKGAAGGEQIINLTTATGTLSNLMYVACSSLCIASAFAYAITIGTEAVPQPGNDPMSIINFSHAASVLMLLLYLYFLYFSLGSHSRLFNSHADEEAGLAEPAVAPRDVEDDKEEYKMHWTTATALMVITVVVIYYCAELLVDAVEGVVATGYLSETFVGMILIPIVGNAAEHVSAIVFAGRDKMDLALSIVVGSSTQIALFAIPLCVMMGWSMGVPMSLHFDTLETICMLLSVFIVIFVLQDGKTNAMEGLMLLCFYGLVAIAYFYYSDGSLP